MGRTRFVPMRSAWLILAFAACSCARQTTQPVRLPPLDAAGAGVSMLKPGEYRLQPGDVIRVKFLFHPELDVKMPIRPDGDITLQVAGEIHAAGLTTADLAKVVQQRSSDRLREPEVAVLVAQLAQQKVYVGGEVRVPGFVVYRAGLSPLQAIMDRGGFTATARVDSVLRLSPGQNEYQGTRLDFTKPLSEGAPDSTWLAAGDVLFVPRTFIGDVNRFVRLYIRGVLPIEPRVGAGTSF
ncbi:MAG: polysaccharide biosynthesis/export family protein [Candidatus Binatia bacterium]